MNSHKKTMTPAVCWPEMYQITNEKTIARQVLPTRQKKPKTDWPEAAQLPRISICLSNRLKEDSLIVIPKAMVIIAQKSL
jgi:hypothetical protein